MQSVNIKSIPAVAEHITATYYVDQSISNSAEELTLVRNNQDDNFENFSLTNIKSITLNTQAVKDNQVINKSYVDQFHPKKERSTRDCGIDFINESTDSGKNYRVKTFNDNKLTNFDNIAVDRDPSSDNELKNQKYILATN